MDEHRQERRLVAFWHHREVHEQDHDCRDERRVDQVRNERFNKVRFGRSRLQVELAG